MAPTSGLEVVESPQTQATKVTSIKVLTESGGLASVPSEYTFTTNPNDQADSNDPEHSIPVIDFSLLTSGSPDQRSTIIHELRKACEEWGFFMLINHGVPESVMKEMINACETFFNLSDEEKKEFRGTKDVLDPIKCGTSFDVAIDKVFLWRDFIKVRSHPQFYSPHKPIGFSEAALEFSQRTREVATELLKAISETLDLDFDYIADTMNWEQGLQLLAANYYPTCPEPDRAIGIPAHTDHGLLTLLIQNEMGGLQVQHKGKWVNWNAMPNAFVYKSVRHRAVVNNRATRISIAVPHGPAIDKVVMPSPVLCEREGRAPAYVGMPYKDYIQLQQSSKSYMKSCLDHIRI
ncbi:hypothetical protein UlMin_033689 [Ulmus minor]